MSKLTLMVTLFLLALYPVSAMPADEPALVAAADDSELQWGPCPDFIPAGCEIAVLHGDPAVPNVDILFKVPAQFDIPWHRHTSAERMILLSGKLTVDYEGQDTVVLDAGFYAYGPAERSHKARCISDEECVLFIAFEEPLDAYPVDVDGH